MLDANVSKVLERIGPDDVVLDVGGWGRCFNRANYVIDKFPFETRGQRYQEILGLGPQGGEVESFSAETWICRDLCDREPWPFPDKFFDFCVCSHTLEDLRDPLWVCSEMQRVARAGYLEVPSMLFELTRGREPHVPVGLSHHFWLVEVHEDTLIFHPKTHNLHGDRRLSLPASFGASMPPERLVTWLFWEEEFSFREGWPHVEILEAWVRSLGPFPDNDSTPDPDGERQHLELIQATSTLRAELWEARERLSWESAQHQATLQRLAELDRQLADVHRQWLDSEASRLELEARLARFAGIGQTSLVMLYRLGRLRDKYPRLSGLVKRRHREYKVNLSADDADEHR